MISCVQNSGPSRPSIIPRLSHQDHPSRSWRGCAMCKPHKRRGAGRATKEPVAVLRKIGEQRRVRRGDFGR